jgi:DNA polymerase I-like protein with 3'-5' exonuclease and polymerase domains
MQYRRFALENELPEAEAKAIHALYNTKAYPGLKDWRKSIQAELRVGNKRMLTNPMGRQVRLLDEWSPSLLDKAYAFKPQSTVADIVNDAMIQIYENQSRTFQAMLPGWAQKHDSLLFNYPVANPYMGQWCNAVREYMSPELSINGHVFRLNVDLKVGYDWSNMKGVEFVSGGASMRERVNAALASLQQAGSSPVQIDAHHPDPEWYPSSDLLDQRAA